MSQMQGGASLSYGAMYFDAVPHISEQGGTSPWHRLSETDRVDLLQGLDLVGQVSVMHEHVSTNALLGSTRFAGQPLPRLLLFFGGFLAPHK